MSGAFVGSAIGAIPSASTLKFVTIGQNGAFNFGYRASGPAFGSIQLTDRIMGQVISIFEYDAAADDFTFEVNESAPSSGFSFTRISVEDATGTFKTLDRASAIAYTGFPFKGWIWNSAGILWTLATVGQTFRIYVQR